MEKFHFQYQASMESIPKSLIASAMMEIQKHTCINFVPHSGQRDYVYINKKQGGCYSIIGRQGGK